MPTNVSRRQFFKGSAASLLATSPWTTQVMAAFDDPRLQKLFTHGVASGDPTANSIVLWTRVSPPTGKADQKVSWQLAADPEFKQLIAKGEKAISAAKDNTVKVLVTELEAGQQYFYRFFFDGVQSEPGRTRTLPRGKVSSLCLAVASCSNFPFGYFNAYAAIAADPEIEFVLHLGDYIYEYGTDSYGGTTGKALNRNHEPAHETISLRDYRTRHAQYKADTASRLLHAAHPLICIWDDHESANNPYKDGAQNHQTETEGSWQTRKAVSLQAYYEWMPLRDPDTKDTGEALWRSFRFGDLATMVSLETRFTGRSVQVEYGDHLGDIKTPSDREHFFNEILGHPDRTMLSQAMETFYRREITRSKKAGEPWRLVANQIPMARIHLPNIGPLFTQLAKQRQTPLNNAERHFTHLGNMDLPASLDTWDGYPGARERFYEMNSAAEVNDLLVLTGDSHGFWTNSLKNKDGQSMGVELGTTSITSPGPFEGYGKDFAAKMSQLLTEHNPEIEYTNGLERGFIKLSLTREQALADYVTVSDILSEKFTTQRLRRTLITSNGKTLNTRVVT